MTIETVITVYVIERWMPPGKRVGEKSPEWLTANGRWTGFSEDALWLCRKQDAEMLLCDRYEHEDRSTFQMQVKQALVSPHSAVRTTRVQFD